MNVEEIYSQTRRALEALLGENRPFFNPVRLLVVGGSSSEIAGGVIGHNSAYELGEAVARAALELSREQGFDVALLRTLKPGPGDGTHCRRSAGI